MSDIKPTGLHLPINIWLVNAEYLFEEFLVEGNEVIRPRVQNLKAVTEQGYALGDFLDDETHLFNEPKELVEIPVLTPVGSKIREVKTLSGAEEVQIPVDAFTYGLYAIMHGLDPVNDILNDADVRWDNDGYTDDDGAVPNPDFDRVATILNRLETINQLNFTLLAQVQPPDPNLGDKFIFCPKLSVSMEEVQQTLTKEYYQQTIMFRSVYMTDEELERVQNIIPQAKKSIGLYSFHVNTPES